MVKLPSYLANNATTRTDPRVVEAMLPYFTEVFGNAASRNHAFGWKAEAAVDDARDQVAALIGASGKEIIFTSGATESNNLAIKGVAAMYRKKGNHVITQLTEHKAVIDPCKRLEREGFQVTYLPVDKYGQVHAEQVAEAMTDKTILVSIMAANNEIGTLQPIQSIGKLCKSKGILFHPDAVQAVGKVPVEGEEVGTDVYLNGHPTERLPGNLNLSFAYVEGEGLMMGIKDIAVSSGSACTSASLEPSYVLKALGVGDELAHSSIRFGLGRFTTEEEIDFTADAVVREVNRLRAMSPLYEMAQQGVDLKTVQWAAH